MHVRDWSDAWAVVKWLSCLDSKSWKAVVDVGGIIERRGIVAGEVVMVGKIRVAATTAMVPWW